MRHLLFGGLQRRLAGRGSGPVVRGVRVGVTLGVLVGVFAGTGPAFAASVGWRVRATALPSVFSASDALECSLEEKCDSYELLVQNVGGEASHGVVKLTDVLPADITTLHTETGAGVEGAEWACNSGAGESTVVCELNE